MNTADDLSGVAIIGMAGRFPKAASVREFWRNTIDEVDCTSPLTIDEIIASGVDPDVAGKSNYVKRAALLEDSDLFDAPFFELLPNEARLTDPQLRIFLECVQEALDDAGCDPDRFDGSIGVYAGTGLNNYLLKNILRRPGAFEDVLDFQTIISNDKDFLSTTVSYKFNLTGPAITIQSACSTSLVAIQLAYQGLLTHQCDLALSGGVHLRFPRAKGTPYREGEIYSPDGICRPFDRQADGTIFGEGVGIVALKRLEDAIAARDHIYGVIRAAALNNDGCDKVSYAAPSVQGQAAVITTALTLAGISADDIGYVEAHGTGTKLGDPIEIRALTQAYRRTTDRKQFCAIGSGKSMIGHLDVAAGVAGLIRATLAVYHRTIPPTLHFTAPNPELDLESTPFYVQARGGQWNNGGKPRIAAVSSFGVGGTNAHAIVAEAVGAESETSSKQFHLLPLSAKSSEALAEQAKALASFLQGNASISLADVGHTLLCGRRQFKHRRALVCQSVEDAIQSLESPTQTTSVTAIAKPGNRSVCFAFSGQGSQYINMCRDLYAAERPFAETFDRCAEAVVDVIGGNLIDFVFSGSAHDDASDKLRQTSYAQPALYAIECGLARLCIHYGITPTAMIGHSIGEFVAAHFAGVFSLEDGARIVARRGALMQQMKAGAMLSLRGRPEHLEPVMVGRNLAIVVVNGPELTVVGGPIADIEEFERELSGSGINSTVLKTSHAFHSFMMDEAVAPFIEEVKGYKFSAPTVPFISNVTGDWITTEQALSAEYWGEHLRSPVQYAAGIETLCRDYDPLLLEVGPGQVLTALQAEQAMPANQVPIVPSVRHVKQSVDDVAFFYRALGGVWANGGAVDLGSFYGEEARFKVPLPGYQFQRKRYWIEGYKPEFEQSPQRTKSTEAAIDERVDMSRAAESRQAPRPLDRADDLLEVVLEAARHALSYDEIRPGDNFFDLGGHSLVAAHMLSVLQEKLGRPVPMDLLTESHSFEQFSQAISKLEST